MDTYTPNHHDCPDCKCPRDWHHHYNGHCYGCNKDCPTQKQVEGLPFEIAQDMELPHDETRRNERA